MKELRFTVRVATPSDAAGVSAALAASYGKLLTSHYSAEQLDRALPLMSAANPVLLRSGRYYVAETSAHQIIACGGWSLERPGTTEIVQGLAHVRHFATDPNWVGCGIASAILSRCIRDAAALGTRSMEAYSTLAAVGFYRTHGFFVVASIDVPLAPGFGFPSTLMRLDTMTLT